MVEASTVATGLSVADKASKVVRYAGMSPGAILVRESFNRAFGAGVDAVAEKVGANSDDDEENEDADGNAGAAGGGGNEWSDLAAKEAKTNAYKKGRGVVRDRVTSRFADVGSGAASAAESALEGKALAGGAGMAKSTGAKSIGAKVLGSGLLGALGWHHIAAGAVGGALLGGTGGVLLGGTAVHAAKLGAAVPAKIAVFHGPNCAAHPVSLVPAQLGRMPGLVHGGALNEAQRKILMANAGKFTTKASSDFLAT
eukprot:TRINITY_DN17468_c0_g1_i1.p2 TRINITY_DN17468_c0_g1~~TRINITY_DN17468_c0_g1_i1.p2  ORF type:complete len:255 (+),score=64.92 TRINITY_DN17468_c0_g1_i1:98-862(+)